MPKLTLRFGRMVTSWHRYDIEKAPFAYVFEFSACGLAHTVPVVLPELIKLWERILVQLRWGERIEDDRCYVVEVCLDSWANVRVFETRLNSLLSA